MIVFVNMIGNMLSNKKINPIVTKLFIRIRKLNFSLFYYTILSCCAKKKLEWILRTMYYKFYTQFIMEIPKKWELQQIASIHSPDIDFRDFMNLYKKCTAKPYSFLVIDATLVSNNHLRFRMNLLESI